MMPEMQKLHTIQRNFCFRKLSVVGEYHEENQIYQTIKLFIASYNTSHLTPHLNTAACIVLYTIFDEYWICVIVKGYNAFIGADE